MESFPPPSFYAAWRNAQRPVTRMEESRSAAPPERWLQLVWLHQRLDRQRLRLRDGRRLRVLHPGFWNREAGPDFQRALVQFENQAPCCGDVEIDVHPAGWRQHGHDRRPAYGGVVLHVVWEGGGASVGGPPQLLLADFLEAPLEELAPWLGGDGAAVLPEEQAGRCAAAWRQLSGDQRRELLSQAALVRLQGKARQMLRRAQREGWEQSLWEGVFRALGYKHNTWPMQNLAELRPRLAEGVGGAVHWQARLLGVGGLLPDEVPGGGMAGEHTRRLWDYWWRDRGALSDCVLPATVWRIGGMRPANHPQRRLALAAHWLAAAEGWIKELERWFSTEWEPRELVNSFLRVLSVHDPFWESHWTLRSRPLAQKQPLLGEARATDLAVNVVLPWFYGRAQEMRQPAMIRRVETRYLAWPAGEDNAVLKLARQRMLGGAPAKQLATAAAQQGLLQIVRDCCDEADALCQPCPFPDLVQQFIAARSRGAGSGGG